MCIHTIVKESHKLHATLTVLYHTVLKDAYRAQLLKQSQAVSSVHHMCNALIPQ